MNVHRDELLHTSAVRLLVLRVGGPIRVAAPAAGASAARATKVKDTARRARTYISSS
jgi:hypothetical protein